MMVRWSGGSTPHFGLLDRGTEKLIILSDRAESRRSVEKQTAVRMANALIVIPLCLQLLYCAGLRTILTNGARGLLPCRVFLSLDQPYHPAPRQSAKCMNDVVPIEHG